MKKKIIIMGAAGRDFHNFNTVFRNNKEYDVVAFTATQIPAIDNRKYPASLAGKLYPKGIPIYPEKQLEHLIKKHNIDTVYFSYSDVSYEYIMHEASRVNATGANFTLMGSDKTLLKSKKKVIAVTAVRTGCGKSQVSRALVKLFVESGKKSVAIRHPMPYGNLEKQAVQRFSEYSDMDKHDCTIEEREEYEPFIDNSLVVYAGIDYEKILREAEKEADIILWDGGNNDLPFIKPDIHIVLTDPHRPGDEIGYYPGEINLRMADIILINKVNTAKKEDIEIVRKNIEKYNPRAEVLETDSVITVEKLDEVRGKKVLVVEDGPTTTHGGMDYGAAFLAAEKFGGKIVDPKKHAVGSIKEAFSKYSQLKDILPALGYFPKQLKELEDSINKTPCDLVLIGTPIDLGKLIKINKPFMRVYYNIGEDSAKKLREIVSRYI